MRAGGLLTGLRFSGSSRCRLSFSRLHTSSLVVFNTEISGFHFAPSEEAPCESCASSFPPRETHSSHTGPSCRVTSAQSPFTLIYTLLVQLSSQSRAYRDTQRTSRGLERRVCDARIPLQNTSPQTVR